MSEQEQSDARFASFQQRYRAGDMPWDAELPPPEVIAIARELAAGRALDLGCGAGRACMHLARAGWQVDGVDYVPEAVAMAAERVRAAGVAEQVQLHVGSVADMAFLAGPYDLAVDVGCLHGLGDSERRAYAAEVARLVRPGGTLLLFAHHGAPGEGPARMPHGVVEPLFAAAFELAAAVSGVTEVRGTRLDSAWYTMRRR
ncbi:class I SAM-dependent methyltransferase [Chloroflexia bacterium SDU3-3]|nr:class I SAM-dependent methyltransferase [Chloroflexia bacterium SDU3-3]